MSIFITLPENALERIYSRAISPEIRIKVLAMHNGDVDPAVIRDLLEMLYRDHDVWCCGGPENPPNVLKNRTGAFFALKYALEALQLIKLEKKSADLEELHLIDHIKKHGFSPWY